ncbi:hypothetical protein PoMZ_01014, partial [Pyricularia oryzae]
LCDCKQRTDVFSTTNPGAAIPIITSGAKPGKSQDVQ